MDIRALRCFLAVAEAGSFSTAAARLHLTQPAVSKRIAALETRLGRRLFDRIGRRVTITDAGRALLPHARQCIAAADEGLRALSHLPGTVAGRLTIATSHHVGLRRLPPLLRRFVREHPLVELDLRFMDSEVACREVLSGAVELAIVTLPAAGEAPPALDCERLWEDPMRVVVGTGHPWAGKAPLPVHALASEPAVLPDETTYTHRIIRAALAAHGVAPRLRMTSNYLETLKMLVSVGLGWSVLPATMVDDGLCALAVPGLALHRRLGIVRHRDRTLGAAAEALCAMARTLANRAADAQ